MAKFETGKRTGKVLKKTQGKKSSTISFAKRSDIKGMSTKNKLKFGSRIRSQSGGAIKKIISRIKSKK